MVQTWFAPVMMIPVGGFAGRPEGGGVDRRVPGKNNKVLTIIQIKVR